VRRGAASCRAVLGSCPVVAAVRAAAPVPSPRSRHGWPSAPGAVTRRGRAAWRVVADREDVRTPARPVVVVSASSGPRWGRPSSRSSGHPASTRPVSRRPVHPGVRTDTLWCPRRCRRPCPRRAGPRSGSVWWAPGRAQRVDVPVVRGRRGGLPASGPGGKGWCGIGLPGSHEVDRSQGRRLAGVRLGAALAPAGRPGRWSRVRVPADGEEHGDGAVLIGPGRASWAGRWCGADHGPGLGGDDHAAWSLGAGGPVSSSSRRTYPVQWGAACGRGAAAAREERCRLAADRSLTSENSGGRDRV
jgi:hypothetical protein